VDERRLRDAVRDGTVAACLHPFTPQPGDCLFLPAGTVHAVGGGVLLAEVQQTSDATFRLYDWDRRDAHGQARPLHLEQALECIDWQRGPVRPVRATGFPGAADTGGWQRLAACPYFLAEYVGRYKPFAVGGTGRLQVLLVLSGRGSLAGEGLTVGDTLVLPASMAEAECVPEGPLAVLRATLPDPVE
jgi:mannose-6-phosphate isomerase